MPGIAIPVWDETAQVPADTYRLRAMEIWGGNDASSRRITVPGLDAAIVSEPFRGEHAGGDLHYLSTCAAGQISRFTLADISGHGAGAGDVAVRLRSLMRKHINTPNPTKFTRALNGEFATLAEGGVFATALITTYFAPTDHFIVCNAGHPRPLIFRASTGRWGLLDHESPGVTMRGAAREVGVGNLPLGIIEGTNYPQFATRLEEGDIIVAYTDALMEAADRAGRQLGEKGLMDIAGTLDTSRPETLRDDIVRAVQRHRDGLPLEDDMTVLVLRHTAENPPPMPLSVRLKTLGKLVGIVKT